MPSACDQDWCTGDVRSYKRHRRNEQDACRPSKQAWARYYRDRYKQTARRRG